MCIRDRKTVVLSILGTYFNGIVLDHFIFDHNIKRRVCVITQKEEELRKFIIEDLHSGATLYEATGAYNMKKRNEIITIVDLSLIHILISLQNGGGKSVLVQMLTAPFVHPKYRNTKDRLFESYFTTNKPSFILVEWALDQGAGYVLTGLMVRKSQDMEAVSYTHLVYKRQV